MAKEAKKSKIQDVISNQEMTLEEAKAFRASLAPKKEKELSDSQKREAFRIYWAKEKAKYNKSKEIEPILWLHLKAIKMDKPEQFESGIVNFGLKKVK